MAYNFPVGYQPAQIYYPNQYQVQPVQPAQQMQTPAQMNGSPIWVQGEAGAKSYLVAPNSTVQLWDSESQTIYLKSADATGLPSMRILDYKIRDAVERTEMPLKGSEPYATMNDLKELEKRLLDRFKGLREGEEE